MVHKLGEGILLTPLKIIPHSKGDILHALKSNDEGFHGFGEAYFSNVDFGQFKGWKRHREMVLNLVVSIGSIDFYLVDDRAGLTRTEIVNLSLTNYFRLTVPAGVWLGFEGISGGQNQLLNLASIPHDPTEADNVDASFFAHYFPEKDFGK